MNKYELRIGNYVNWNKETAIVGQLWEKDVCFKCGETDLYSSLKPIELTEDWLLKFGFDSDFHDQIGTYWNIGHFQIIENLPHLDSEFGICLNGINVFTKYVHQLQNLYFALTGNELTVSPTKTN